MLWAAKLHYFAVFFYTEAHRRKKYLIFIFSEYFNENQHNMYCNNSKKILFQK